MDYLEPMTAAVRAAANIYRSAKNDLHIEVKQSRLIGQAAQ